MESLKLFVKKYKKSHILILLIIVIIAIAIITINHERINNIVRTIFRADEPELLSYVVYDNQDSEKIKVLATFSSTNGIEYVEEVGANRVEANGKNKLHIDYIVKENEPKTIKIKEKGRTEKTEQILVNDSTLNQTTIEIEKDYEIEGYKTIVISNLLNWENYKLYYKKGTEDWTEVNTNNVTVPVLDYAVTTQGLINDDNTITISAKLVNQNNSSVITLSKKYEIDTNSTLKAIPSKSLIDAVQTQVVGTGNYDVFVNGEEYNLSVFCYDTDLTISTNTEIGTGNEVATASEYAKSMVVLKVNGDLTIDSGAKLTTVASTGGYGGPKGFFIYCTGTITNNGEISMTARGARAEGQNVYMWKNNDETYEYVPADGASGGNGMTGSTYNFTGVPGSKRTK